MVNESVDRAIVYVWAAGKKHADRAPDRSDLSICGQLQVEQRTRVLLTGATGFSALAHLNLNGRVRGDR